MVPSSSVTPTERLPLPVYSVESDIRSLTREFAEANEREETYAAIEKAAAYAVVGMYLGLVHVLAAAFLLSL